MPTVPLILIAQKVGNAITPLVCALMSLKMELVKTMMTVKMEKHATKIHDSVLKLFVITLQIVP